MDATLIIQTIGLGTLALFVYQRFFANPVIGKCCVSGGKVVGEKKGEIVHINGVDTYISKPSQNTDRAIIIATDAFGLDLYNNYYLSDKFAEAGFLVAMPDLFEGRPVPGRIIEKLGEDQSKLTLLQRASNMFDMASEMIPFMVRSIRVSKKIPIIQDVITELRLNYGIKKIGVTGYCYGGKVIALMNQDASIEFDSSAMNHPSMLSVPNDIEQIRKPVLFNCAESDFMLSPEKAKKSEEILNKNGITNKFITYPGTTHGFAVRPKYNEPKEAMQQALNNAVDFFNTTM